MKIYNFIILIVLIFSITSYADEEVNASLLLSKLLGDSIEIINDHEIRYCPDNTCEIFRSGSSTKKEKLAEFVFLYLFHISDYIYLDQSFPDEISFRKSAKKYEPLIRSKTEIYCKLTNPNPKCILDSMKSIFQIKVSFGRYNEDKFNES